MIYLNGRPGRFLQISPFYRGRTWGTEMICSGVPRPQSSQVSGPGPCAPTPDAEGWTAPGSRTSAHLGRGNMVPRKTSATARFGLEPEPPGDKTTFVIIPFSRERRGAPRVRGGGSRAHFLPRPSGSGSELLPPPAQRTASQLWSGVSSTCVSVPEIQSQLEKAYLRFPVFLSRGPIVGTTGRGAQGPLPLPPPHFPHNSREEVEARQAGWARALRGL